MVGEEETEAEEHLDLAELVKGQRI
jgi:hypothetical protein